MRRIVTAWLLVCCCLALRAAEPELTQDEAKLLKKAQAAEDTAQAIAILRQGMGRKPSPAMWFALGTFLAQSGDNKGAIEANREALSALPGFTRARHNLALALLKQESWANAADELRRLLDSPDEPARQVWPLLGYVYRQLGHPVASEEAYRRALVYDPANGDWRRGLANALLAQGKLTEAGQLATREVEREPMQSTWWLILVKSDLAAGHPDAAMARLECMRRLGLADRDALATLGDLMAQASLPAEALKVYQACAALEKPPVDRLLRAASAMASLGQLAEAEGLLKAVSSTTELSDDQAFERDRQLADLAYRQGHVEDAWTRLRALEGQRPTDGPLLLTMGDVQRDRGQADDAKAYYQRAARANSALRPDALARQARLAVDRGDLRAAIALIEEAVSLDSQPYLERYLARLRRLAQ